MDLDSDIRANLAAVRDRIEAACARAGRDPAGVTLVGVTKTRGADVVAAAVRAGLADLGENYAQELVRKASGLPAGVAPRWHFIGALQTNKVRHVAGLISAIHSVDRPSLADELAKRLPAGAAVDVFVEVGIAGEEQKSGMAPAGAEALCRRVLEVPSLRLAGLMCVPPDADDPEASRPHFRALRELRDRLLDAIRPPAGRLAGLSMGMSHDLEVAVQEGATVVRVGTALFGRRG
ncbi:MAG: YggS family pyridoxal phosphate-dependent enzyme [Deltaproteobacteria bacterium]|nr:YggS family pyridoxal phosphate-dependent enzyme [Deltaproteobacteria bacterium]